MSQPAEDPAQYLKALGEAGEGPHDIAQAALMLSLLDHPQDLLAPYRAHLDEIAHHAREDARLERMMENWPSDVREHVLLLIARAWREEQLAG